MEEPSPHSSPVQLGFRLMRVEGRLEDGEILNWNWLRKEDSLRDNSVQFLDQVSMNTGSKLLNMSGETSEWFVIHTGMNELEMICRKK